MPLSYTYIIYKALGPNSICCCCVGCNSPSFVLHVMHHTWPPNIQVLVPPYSELMLHGLEFIERFGREIRLHFIQLKVKCFRKMRGVNNDSGCLSASVYFTVPHLGK